MQDVKNALRANASKSAHCAVQDNVKCFNPWDCQSKRQHDVTGCYPTLQAYNGGGGRCDGIVYPNVARTLAARHDSSPCLDRGQNVVAIDCRNLVGNEELSATLQAKNEGGFSLNYQNPICYRAGGYGDMVEGVGTLRANGGDAGGGTESIVVERVFDARGNGDGATVPTMTGHHNANISDYTAIVVERSDE